MIDEIKTFLENSDYTLVEVVSKKEVYVQDLYGTYKTTYYRLKSGVFPTTQTVLDFPKWLMLKAEKVHGSSISLEIPESCKTLKDSFTAICKIHGKFLANYTNLIFTGSGCQSCYKGSLNKTSEVFKEQAYKVHNNTYDYSLVDYRSAKEKVRIKCNTHGEFLQTPDKHLKGQGCPKCALTRSKICGFSRNDFVESSKRSSRKPYLYIIKCYDTVETFYKIGITSHDLKTRFSGSKLPYNFELVQKIEHLDPGLIYDLEQSLHKFYRSFKYTPLKIFNGFTECYRYEI